jgi:YkoY family integral membrane protein
VAARFALTAADLSTDCEKTLTNWSNPRGLVQFGSGYAMCEVCMLWSSLGSSLLVVVQLIFLEGILSIDNAAVLGAMVAHLPDQQAIPWPESLQSLGEMLQGMLGPQRTAALRVGLLGAYVGRGLMLVLANVVIRNSWLRLLGAGYLIRLAFDNLGQTEPGEADGHTHPTKAGTFWAIVLTIELADLAFSLDNVVAAVALSNQLWVVMLGVAIGILMMRFAAGLFSYAVEREPVLTTAAYVLVLNIGIELLLEDLVGIHVADGIRFSLSVATIGLALAYAHWRPLHVFRPALVWLAQGFGNINEVIDWVLAPLLALARLIGRGVRRVVQASSRPFPEEPG